MYVNWVQKVRISPRAISRQMIIWTIARFPLPTFCGLEYCASQAECEMAATEVKKPRHAPPFVTVSDFWDVYI